jgi:hypothetical protein
MPPPAPDSSSTPVPDGAWTVGVFAVAALAFFAWRMSFDLIWDDSPAVTTIELDRIKLNPDAGLLLGQPGAISYYFRYAFSTPGGNGYRPLSAVVSNAGASFFRPGGPPRWMWIALVSSIVGGFAAAFFRVALRFSGSSGWAAFALIVLLASPPYLCAAAVIFAGIQTIVPLAVCGSLLLYWSATADGASLRRRRASYAALAVLLIAGPWFREFIGLSSVLIAGLELLKHRRPTRLVAMTAVSFLHALFPTALVKWTVYPNLPLLPVFQLGHLGRQAGSGDGIRWEALVFLLTLVPSTLWLLSLLGMPVRMLRLGFRKALFDRDWVFLWGWFLLSFLPFLKLFTEHVHLLYALVPGSILAAVLLRDLHDGIRARARWLRPLFAAAVVLTLCDQCTNFIATHVATVRIIDGYRAVADAIARKTRPGDVIVANFPGSEEVRYHGRGRNTVYFTVAVGVPHRSRVVDEPAKLQRLLDATRPGHDVYFLAAEFDYLPGKDFFHPHKYVRYHTVETRLVGVLHETRAVFPYLDPIKQLIPREFMPFPASPDLMNDFYFGPARDGRPFRREIYARYDLYRVTGRKVDPWLPTQDVEMVESGRQGYNILACNGRYFAIQQSEGDFDVGRACRGEYKYCGFADSLDRIHAWIAAQLPLPDESPQLVADYRGYNIIRFGIRYYGIRQGDGAFEPDRFRRGRFRNAVQGADLATVKHGIDAHVYAGLAAASHVPLLAESNYRGYNVIVLHGRFYGIRQDDGGFDPERYRKGDYRDAVDGADVPAVKRRIDAILTTAAGERTHS